MSRATLTSRSTTHYWAELDGVRSLAFLLVFMSHVGAVPALTPPLLHPIRTIYNVIVSWGWIGVDLFLVLSGFLITSLLLKERQLTGNISFKFFFIRRMLRLWPLYYLVFFLGFFIFPLFQWMGIGYGTPARSEMLATYFTAFLLFFGNLQFAHGITVISPMVASLWTVCLEEQFYVVWGSLLTLFKNKRPLVALIGGLLIAAVGARYYVQAHSTSHHPYYYNTLTHADPLLIGALAAIAWRTYEQTIRRFSLLLGGTGVIIIASIMITMPPIFQNHPSIVWAMSGIAIGWGAFLLGVISNPSFKRLFQYQPLTSMGKVTYGMYLFHFPILVTWVAFTHKHLTFLSDLQTFGITFSLTLLATLLLARWSWRVYERPFNALRAHFTNSTSLSSPLTVPQL